MAQRQWERTTLATRERVEEEAEDGSTDTEDNTGSVKVAAELGGVGELPGPSGVWQTTGEG